MNYFSHDSNARNDDKIIALRMKYGWEGYGIYWAIIEKLRDASGYMCVKDYNVIAFDLRADAAKIKSIIEEFGLFVFTEDGKYLYSESLMRRMEQKDEKSEKARKSAYYRWSKNEENERNANAMRTQCDGNAINKSKEKESKEKESKENNNTLYNPPEGDLDESKNSSKKDLGMNLPNNPPAGEKEKKSCAKRKEKAERKKEPQAFIESIPEPEWRGLFARWLKYKQDINDSYKSEDSLKMALEKLKKMSGSDISVATEIVKNSIANNWRGLFPLKNIYNNGINRNSEIYEVYAPVSDFSGTKSTL